MKKNFFILFSILISVNLFAQKDSTSTYSLNFNFHEGVLLPEYGFINYVSNDYVRGIEVNVRKQTFGKTFWDQLYRYPSYGVTLLGCSMGNKLVFGNQFSIYPFYMINLLERKKITFSYQMGFGAAFATKKFNIENNTSNLAIGSNLNFFYDASLLFRVNVNSKIIINTGIAFKHISNANLSEPNVGLNIATLNAGIGYKFGKVQQRKIVDIPTFEKKIFYTILVNGGVKHTRTFESFRYPAFSFVFEIHKRSRYKFAWGIGADFFYDSSIEPQLIRLHQEFKNRYAFQSGIHFSQEFIYNKASLVVQEGVYIGLTDKLNHHPIYNRVIVRYQIVPRISINLSLKSYLYILDFPELGVGFKL